MTFVTGYCKYYIGPIGDRPVHFLRSEPNPNPNPNGNHIPKHIPNLTLTQYA